jgi:hypothetical protein
MSGTPVLSLALHLAVMLFFILSLKRIQCGLGNTRLHLQSRKMLLLPPRMPESGLLTLLWMACVPLTPPFVGGLVFTIFFRDHEENEKKMQRDFENFKNCPLVNLVPVVRVGLLQH